MNVLIALMGTVLLLSGCIESKPCKPKLLTYDGVQYLYTCE